MCKQTHMRVRARTVSSASRAAHLAACQSIPRDRSGACARRACARQRDRHDNTWLLLDHAQIRQRRQGRKACRHCPTVRVGRFSVDVLKATAQVAVGGDGAAASDVPRECSRRRRQAPHAQVLQRRDVAQRRGDAAHPRARVATKAVRINHEPASAVQAKQVRTLRNARAPRRGRAPHSVMTLPSSSHRTPEKEQ